MARMRTSGWPAGAYRAAKSACSKARFPWLVGSARQRHARRSGRAREFGGPWECECNRTHRAQCHQGERRDIRRSRCESIAKAGLKRSTAPYQFSARTKTVSPAYREPRFTATEKRTGLRRRAGHLGGHVDKMLASYSPVPASNAPCPQQFSSCGSASAA